MNEEDLKSIVNQLGLQTKTDDGIRELVRQLRVFNSELDHAGFDEEQKDKLMIGYIYSSLH